MNDKKPSDRFLPMKCPNCGGELRVPENKESIICMYCGGQVLLQKEQKDTGQIEIENLMKLADSSREAENYDEAYNLYTRILEVDEKNARAWAGRAECAGMLSTLDNFRFEEAKKGFETAVKYFKGSGPGVFTAKAVVSLSSIAQRYFLKVRSNLTEFIELRRYFDDACNDYVDVVDTAIVAIEDALRFFPKEINLLGTIVAICSLNIDDVPYFFSNPSTSVVAKDVAIPNEFRERLTQKYLKYCDILLEVDPTFEIPEVDKLKKKKKSNFDISIAKLLSYAATVGVIISCLFWLTDNVFSPPKTIRTLSEIELVPEKVNIRSSPSIESRILGRENSGSRFKALDDMRGWAKIEYKDGYAYVAKSVAKKIYNTTKESNRYPNAGNWIIFLGIVGIVSFMYSGIRRLVS